MIGTVDLTLGHGVERFVPRSRVALLESLSAEAGAIIDVLRQSDIEVIHLHCSEDFIELLARESFDMLILDWSPEDLSGYEMLRHVREELHLETPVMMLSSRGAEAAVVLALNDGANDFVVKPWRPRELLARVNALLRGVNVQAGERKEEVIEGWRFGVMQKLVTHGSLSVKLPHKEFEVARVLFRHLGRPLARENLMQAVWAEEVSFRTVATHVSRVRLRLGLTAKNGYNLHAIYNFGYRLDRIGTPLDLPPRAPSQRLSRVNTSNSQLRMPNSKV